MGSSWSHDLHFSNVEMLSFKPAFSLSYFTFRIKRFFSSSSLYAIRVVSSAYLRLLIFLPSILIPACASSSPAFLMRYPGHKLNKQGDNIQPWCTPFLIWNQYVVPCPVLTVASWPAYRFLRGSLILTATLSKNALTINSGWGMKNTEVLNGWWLSEGQRRI